LVGTRGATPIGRERGAIPALAWKGWLEEWSCALRGISSGWF
jgi:hypothetical protein